MAMGCKRCVGEHRNGEACPVAPPPVPGDSLEGQRHGPLLLKRRWEVGAVASVYLAEYVPTGHRFAVKVLHAHLAARPAVRSRFIAEALAQRSVVHRHVARVLDVRPGPMGLPCVLMEAPEGEPLSAMPLPLSPVEVGEVLDQALAGLEAAHSRGVVHGDLTLDALVVARDAKGARHVRVRDFGAGAVRDAALSPEERAQGVMVGSPTFMAPEQCAGTRGGPRADVHALGVAGYLLVTGRLPFGLGRSADVALFPPHAINASVPPALSTVLLRAMAARPEERFDSAWAFRVALAQSLGLSAPVRNAAADAREDVSEEFVTQQGAESSGASTEAVASGEKPLGASTEAATREVKSHGAATEAATREVKSHGAATEAATREVKSRHASAEAFASGMKSQGVAGDDVVANWAAQRGTSTGAVTRSVMERDAAEDFEIVEDVPEWGGVATSMEDAALRAADIAHSDTRAGEVAMRAEVAAFWASAVALLEPTEPEPPSAIHTSPVAAEADSSGSTASGAMPGPHPAPAPGAPILLVHPAMSTAPIEAASDTNTARSRAPILLVDPASPLSVTPMPAVSPTSTLGAAAIPFMTLAPSLDAAPIPLVNRVLDAASTPLPLTDAVAPLEASAPRTDALADLRVRLGLTPGEGLQPVSVSDVAPEGLFAECQGALPPLAARLTVEVSFRGDTVLGSCDVVRHVTFDEARTWNVPAGVFVHFSDESPALGRLLSRALIEDAEPAPDAELARLLSRAEAVARDPYALLGAKPGADFGDIHHRAQAALRRLVAFQLRPLPTAQWQALEALRVRVLAAQRMLGEPLSRVGHDATRGNLAGLARCVAAGVPEPTLEALRSAFLAARPEVESKARALFTQGHALEVQRAIPAALERYAEALKLDPLNTSWLKHYQALLRQVPGEAGARMGGGMA
ncbi:serine/threonine protein kinase [Corallococcus sp. Z5C101001]|uniref:serine/threonine protein kinase n=1 Tax=Corallococcus sp. Z5C101001 TaxID=2596829 RepID=UPI002101E7FB|nr:serine/threonine protein kinase [Corallococcus sp. Z5C101001]